MLAFRAILTTALVAAIVTTSTGCGGRELGEVEGAVTLDGAPLPDAEVTFIPDPVEGKSGNNATAVTDAQGRYKLRSAREGRDGAPPGSYRVVVVDLLTVADFTTAGAPPKAGEGDPTKAASAKKRRLPPTYGDPAATPLKGVQIKAGKQTHDIALKVRGG